jgi:hypothetical protein
LKGLESEEQALPANTSAILITVATGRLNTTKAMHQREA